MSGGQFVRAVFMWLMLAMRDRLAEDLGEVKADPAKIAEWLIASGWVTEEPKEKNE